MENYLSILEESLQKKYAILQTIENINGKQLELIQDLDMSLEAYDAYVDEKDVCIGQLDKLDEGFEGLYEKIAGQLQQNRQKYAEQIRRMQELIRQITEKSVSIQAQEARNKEAVEQFFRGKRQGIRKARLSSKAALDYYQSMNQSKVVDAQFMDKKK